MAAAMTHASALGKGGSGSRHRFMSQSRIAAQLNGHAPDAALPAQEAGAAGGRHGLLDHPTMMAATKGCVFIKAVGQSLGLPARTIGTAQLLAHRVHIFQASPPGSSTDIATACLLVAAKMEETIKRVHEILAHSYVLTTQPGAGAASADAGQVAIAGAIVNKMRPSVLAAEQFVMEAIGFDFRTAHPHLLYVKLAKLAGLAPGPRRGSKQTTAAAGWTILSDAFFTTLPVQYPPAVLAAGALCLAWYLDCELPAAAAPFILEALSLGPAAEGGSSGSNSNGTTDWQSREQPRSLDLAADGWWTAFGVATKDMRGFVRQAVDFYLLFFSSAIATPAYMEQHESGLPSKDMAQRIGQWRMWLDDMVAAPGPENESRPDSGDVALQ
ncbi:RNA polymerase II C-terminal domain kinase beta subunit [Coemansia helicoidea]|uniref:RNA polymerase II C-terminal domain kinase beta subunit n=1 Tax=Coemansia helicoidea TaxID=1286919 RepID=A0ACC1L9J6_9FUNG|nr:RNA polymerase II C-terminal domain kinase beta subunit [Coemansia helicoidea]